MSSGVRDAVASRARAQNWSIVWWLLAAPACVGLGCGFGALVGPGTVGALVVGFLVGFIGPVACLLAASDGWTRGKRLRRDLARGEVEVLEGRVVVVTGHDEALGQLLASGAFGNDPSAEHRVVLLAASGLLHSVDDVARTDFLVPDVLDVAEERAPRPLVDATAGAVRPIALTSAEQAEIAVRASQFWKTPAALFGPIAYATLGFTMWYASGSEWLARYWPVLTVWGVVGALALVRLVLRYRTAALLAEDGTHGEALEVIDADEDGTLHRFVVLPRCGLVWSADGAPAEWRSRRA